MQTYTFCIVTYFNIKNRSKADYESNNRNTEL